MFDKDRIIAATSGLVAWRTSSEDHWGDVGSDYKQSSSGYYVNQLPGINLKLINSLVDETDLYGYIENLHETAGIQVVDDFINRAKDQFKSRELVSNAALLHRRNDLDQKVTKNSRFIGYVITPKPSKNIKATIERIGLLSDASESLTFYLFKLSKTTAIATVTVTGDADDVTWTAPGSDFQDVIEYESQDGGSGNEYLIGYFEDDLSGQVYEQDWKTSSLGARRKIDAYLGVRPIRIGSGDLNGVDRPDLDSIEGQVSDLTPGFDLEFNVVCDITDILISNIGMFARAVQYRMAVQVLEDALSSYEHNNILDAGRNREMLEENLAKYRGELYGGYMAVTEGAGKAQAIYKPGIIERISIDFSGMDSVCLPCKDDIFKKGVVV